MPAGYPAIRLVFVYRPLPKRRSCGERSCARHVWRRSGSGEEQISELVGWALPIQERHLQQVRECALNLAAEEDPYEK